MRLRAATKIAGAVALVGLGQSSKAAACGPCDVPDVVDATYAAGELFVHTNFGILRKRADGWHLECEELMGGTITGAVFNDQAALVGTSSGFFRDGGERCAWDVATEGASNDWFLDFAAFEAGGDAGSGQQIVALDIDRETSETKIELAELGGAFSTLATFGAKSGLRRILAGGDPARIVATGYTYSPTTLHVLSAELGETDFVDRAFVVEGWTSELRPLAMDPVSAERLWIRAAELAQDPDALLVLDPGDEAPREAFRLGADERLADVAFADDRVFIAARGNGVSRIYAADSEALDFEAVAELPGVLTCLDVTEREWLACNSDFTRDSVWLVATSDDQGASWTPELTLDDLGELSSCGESCGTTTAWLYGLFGADVGAPSSTGGRDFEDPPAAADAGSDRSPRPPRKESGCALRSGSTGESPLGWLLLLAFSIRRLRHARHHHRAR